MKTEVSIGFSHFPDGIVVADPSSRVVLANSSMPRVTGLKRGVVVGQRMSDLLKKKVVSASAVVRVIAEGVPCTLRSLTMAGKENLVTARPVFDGRGNLEWIVCGIKDVSELRAASVMGSKSAQTEGTRWTSIIAENKQMQDVVRLANLVAHAESNVLIDGETGVGKELVARLIYERGRSKRRNGAFVKVNCAAIPASLFESELFGYERGAFTGALSTGRGGLIEMADNGVLFLDEIGDLPSELQGKLLHVIEDQQFMHVGGRSVKTVKVRIIAATNRDLRQLTNAGGFRQDLYYRIATIPIRIPPLRERPEDIRALVTHYMEKLSRRYVTKKSLAGDLSSFLLKYQWPGNVRELSNVLEYLFLTVGGPLLGVGDLPPEYSPLARPETSLTQQVGASGYQQFRSLKSMVKEYELGLIMGVMKRATCYEEAAKHLGISFATLNRRLKEARNVGKIVH
ncbi:MAG TPA: sigma 54-interacting transcriptional regulator [Syntrophorhabdaceae bacterium]|nr:sigma 54-interacting transcriptional regulator [Syntrophorhabdaceae bacterium]